MPSKPGEASVKWQLCYDMTAKMWWMVSGLRAWLESGGGGAGLEHKGLPKPAGSGETQVDLEQVRSGIFHRVQRVDQAGGLLSSTVQGDRGD